MSKPKLITIWYISTMWINNAAHQPTLCSISFLLQRPSILALHLQCQRRNWSTYDIWAQCILYIYGGCSKGNFGCQTQEKPQILPATNAIQTQILHKHHTNALTDKGHKYHKNGPSSDGSRKTNRSAIAPIKNVTRFVPVTAPHEAQIKHHVAPN